MTPEQLAKSGTEHANQRALFAWANMAEKYGLQAANTPNSYVVKGAAETILNDYNDKIPQLKWLHAIHNQGHGDAIRGAKAKAEGVKTGIWDIFLPVSIVDEYCGLYIEMKVGNNKLTVEQSEFGQFAINQGYKTVVCYSWQDARDCIVEYLGLV